MTEIKSVEPFGSKYDREGNPGAIPLDVFVTERSAKDITAFLEGEYPNNTGLDGNELVIKVHSKLTRSKSMSVVTLFAKPSAGAKSRKSKRKSRKK